MSVTKISVFGENFYLEKSLNNFFKENQLKKIIPEEASKEELEKFYQSFLKSFSLGYWEQNTFETLKINANQSKIAIDIGAHFGLISIWLSKNFSSVYSIEADPVALYFLKKNTNHSQCKNISIIENPISDIVNEKVFFGRNAENKAALGLSMSQMREQRLFEDDFEAYTVNIKKILDEAGRKNVGFIKVDIEGGEERIIPDLFSECSDNGYNLFFSFHVPWWKNQDVERFIPYFELAKNYHSENILPRIKEGTFFDIYFSFK